MSSIQVREVNVVPITKIKKEIIDDELSEDTILCKICSKSFVSEMAVRNHARMEHIDQFMRGDDLYDKPELKRKHAEELRKNISELVSSMQPTSITSLASQDVSYIIIKDKGAGSAQKMRKIVKLVKEPKPEKKVAKKETKPISGPFECLQPSSNNPGTLCHQIFLSCCEYSAHYRDEHTRRRKGNRCQVCEKHIANNEQLAPYSCQVCGMGFESSDEFKEHSQTAHIKLKPFQCSVCFKRFTQQGGLQQHMRRHTGDRPFPCTYCPKAFTQKSGLDQHLRIHTKEKPYRCVVCSKAFCQSVHLQQHMRTHTNVAPFQCGICHKRFKQSGHLNYHLKYHNVVKMTAEQKQKYAELVSQMLLNTDCVNIEIDPVPVPQQKISQDTDNLQQNSNQSETQQEIVDLSEMTQEEIDQSQMTQEEIDQSQMTQEEIDQSEMTQEEIDQSEMTQEEIDQSQMTQEEIDQSETIQEVDQSECQQDETTREVGETVYFLDDGVWCEGVVCGQ